MNMKTNVRLPGEEEENGKAEVVKPETGLAVIHCDPEIDIQISTAKRYPRSITKSIKAAIDLATHSEDIAVSCIYNLKRTSKSGKKIDIPGPSVRLAEIVASSWNNMRIEARPVEEGARFVESEATAWDLETNVAIRVRSRRRITDKYGNRFSDDMIGMTSNAASSIALRNAIFRVVPKSVVEQVYLAARNAAVGGQATLSARRQKMVDSFAKMGVTEERLLSRLDKPGINDITLDDLEKAIGLFNEVKNGDADIDEVFPEPKQEFTPKAQGKDAPARDEPPPTDDGTDTEVTVDQTPEGQEQAKPRGGYEHTGKDAEKVDFIWTALMDDANGDTAQATLMLAALTEFPDKNDKNKTIQGVERFEDLSPKRLDILYGKIKKMVEDGKTKAKKKGKAKNGGSGDLPFG